MNGLDLFTWFLTHWPVVLWVIAIVLGFAFGGWRLALLFLTLGVAHTAYFAGRKQERDNAQAKAEKIQKERENAYDQIDARGTGRDDVIERLRDNKF